MKVSILTLVLIWLAALQYCGEASPTSIVRPDIYVSTVGNDSWSGRYEKPNLAGTDGPFATIDRARIAARTLRADLKHAGPIVVSVRGGTYYLKAPLKFTPEDSGPAIDRPIVYEAYHGEQPIVSGGVRLTGMRLNALHQWETRLAGVTAGKWVFSQLFADGERRTRPRMPKYSYYNIKGSVPPTAAAAARGYVRFAYNPGEFKSDWYDLTSVETLCFQTWTMARLRISSLDDNSHTVTFTGPTNGTESYAALPQGNRFIIENVREALQDPGEWYLDRRTGVLTYIPMPIEALKKTAIVAPNLNQLVLLQGDAKAHKWVENISFHSIVFAHTNWNSPPEGNAFSQAEVNLNAAIAAEGARHCSFTGCSIKHTGAWAIELGAGCQENTVESCEFSDLGAGGVKIGGMSVEQDPEMVAKDNVIRNCLIAHGGRIHPAAVGVWIGQSPGNQIIHNRIADFYYTGISVGWTWGYGTSLARDNHLEYNSIEDIGQGVLSDMGGIYTLGISTGSVEDHNVIRDVESFDYGGWGIYTDEGSSNILISNNIVYRTKTGGFHQHYGENNHITNNIFAFSKQSQIIRTRVEDHLSFTFDHNIVFFKEGTLLGSNWSGDQYHMNNNVYWDESGRLMSFAGETFEKWQKKGQDTESLVADPLFTAPDEGVFHLKPDSPALKIGIIPIDSSQVGPHPTGGMKFNTTTPPRAFPPPPQLAPPAPPPPPFAAVPSLPLSLTSTRPRSDKTFIVCIDPGHPSEVNSGMTVQNGTTEAHIDWVVAQDLRDKLIQLGYKVVTTKSFENELVKNKNRALVANHAMADLTVRLHCDASPDTGYALYYPDRKGTAHGKTGPTLEVMSRSKSSAELLDKGMASVLARVLKNGGVRGDSKTLIGSKQGALTGSIFSEVPVVTIEMVVLSNASDAAFIKTQSGQQKMADAIAAGIELCEARKASDAR